MVAANPALTPYVGMYQYNAQVHDKGTFKDMPGAFTPNQDRARQHLRPVQVSGPVGLRPVGRVVASPRPTTGSPRRSCAATRQLALPVQQLA